MKLLEEQHQKLAQIIKTQDTSQEATEDDLNQKDPVATSSDVSSKTAQPERATASTNARPAQSSLAGARIGNQQRDSSPSLAREIASRRGIPQPGRNQASTAAQARARQLSPESRHRVPSGGSSSVPPSLADSQADLARARKAQKATDDEGFTRFYNNLTTGTMSKLSSVLAYAGLPLTVEDTPSDQTSKRKSDKRIVSAANEPDVKKVFSKAALDAIEDEHRQRGTLGHGFGPAESFYVVQKGGGTYSYADIARAHQQQLSGMGEDEEPEFVDAKEVQGQPSPKTGRFHHSTRSSFGNPRTNEELDLENATLKQTLQDLAGRLAAFEAHAQDASFAALTQSVANLRPQGGADPAMQERIRQLEKEVENQAEERQKLESLNSKQDKMLKKYHSKFEEIKKSAKEKEKAKREKAAKEAEEPVADVAEAS